MSSPQEKLPVIFQEVLTAIVRLRANASSVRDVVIFRAQFLGALATAEESAVRAGYNREDAALAKFSTVAFLDESVLNSDNPVLAGWARKPLQEEVFGVHVAGELFFRNLDRCLEQPDAFDLADLLEVFGLCLRLGFRGRFRSANSGEIRTYLERILDRIGRIRAKLPVPSLVPLDIPATIDPWVRRLTWIAVGSVMLAFLLFGAYSLTLRSGIAAISSLSSGTDL